MDNKHSTAIPANILTQVQGFIKQANTALLPYVKSLTPNERQIMAKMGEKTLSFVEKAHEFALQNANLVPPFLDMKEFDTDFADAHNLWAVLLASQQLHENLDDTTMVAGSEAYQAALIFYNSAKMAAKQDIPGAKAVFEELRKRFPHGKHKNPNETDTENEAEE
jgi:hypothetical protein